MTTIAYRNGVLAADSRETNEHDNGTSFVVSDKCQKLYVLPDGSVVGCAGSSESGHLLVQSLIKKTATPKLEHTEAMHITRKGVFLYEGSAWLPMRDRYYAIGSGAGYAIAAMKAKASAIEACRIGAEMDPCSGGSVRWRRVSR